MSEVQYFKQCRMSLNSQKKGSAEYDSAVEFIHNTIEKHEEKGDIHSFMKQAQCNMG